MRKTLSKSFKIPQKHSYSGFLIDDFPRINYTYFSVAKFFDERSEKVKQVQVGFCKY